MSYSAHRYHAQPREQIVNAPTGFKGVVPLIPLAQIRQAIQLHQQGDLAAAEEIYTRVLSKHPAQFECVHFLGLLRHQQGRTEEGIVLLTRAIAINNAEPAAHANLGLLLHAAGRHQQALDSCNRALALDPHFVIALNNRGNAWRALGRMQEALADYEAAAALQPDYADAQVNCALLLQSAGRVADALKRYDKLVALRPTADFHHARGCMQRLLFLLDAALESFDKALQLQPAHADAWCNKASTHYLMGQQQAALDAFAQCVRLDPQSAEARFKQLMAQIPAVRERADDLDKTRERFAGALAAFRQWIDAQPAVNPLEVVGTAQPFYLAYEERNNRDLLAPYGRLCTELMASWSAQHGIAHRTARRSGAAKIRVGVVSAHFIHHPVWTAIVKGWFSALDRDSFELHAFDLGSQEDAQTAMAKESADSYHRGAGSALEWARRIIAVDPDVLIYPELGMDQLTTQLAAMRLAPRQVATWGHPETSGMPTIDAYLSARAFEHDAAQACYSERLIALPNLGCYYDPPEVAPAEVDIAALGVRPGAPLFICAGSPFKYTPEHDHVFVDIARKVAGAQFLFFTNPRLSALSEKYRHRIASAFADAGLDPARHMLAIPWQAPARFYGIMRQAHVFLDTIGFSGFNTAMQAVECGLPIVTVEGSFMRGRFASAILKRIGLDELVHSGSAEYVATAVRVATDEDYRRRLRSVLVARRAILYRDTVSIRGFEHALRMLCANLP
ncbi:MAG TPA: tetratricopeptide repeat protein [Noviherbaspirillum sp.]|uniref:tetratricopeptide repeat protein n=1 Tax=Noviherbaspirillum sp. TaxID=1926288 RepID=UPI002D4E0C65|nr:tetratricopeptide repeat protein [Noviherbaspirillum sp.]HYD96844.1 tetratricopeptide repeat protein [Noviherbaspirillum sp.]